LSNNQSDTFNAALRNCDNALRKLGLGDLIAPPSLLPTTERSDEDESEES